MLPAPLLDLDPNCPLGIAADYCADRGDWEAHEYLTDYLARMESAMLRPPMEKGQVWLVCTVTLYYLGRVKDLGLGWVQLEEASWVHWTGRLSVLTALCRAGGALNLRDPRFGQRRPRTEFCGDAVLSTAAIVSAYGPYELTVPPESVE